MEATLSGAGGDPLPACSSRSPQTPGGKEGGRRRRPESTWSACSWTFTLDFPTQYDQFEPLTGTLTALVESGDLRLIRPDSLRFELVAYLALVDASEEILFHTETLIWNSVERVALGRARHSQSSLRRATTQASGWGEIDVSAALNDPEIISAMQIQTVASQVRTFSLGRLEEPLTRIIRLLQAELE